jgi:hypothetical protein
VAMCNISTSYIRKVNYPPVQPHSVGSPLISVRETYEVYSQESVSCLLCTQTDAVCAMMTLDSGIKGFVTRIVQTDSKTFANQEQHFDVFSTVHHSIELFH